MTKTPDLIDALVAGAAPVRRLAPPLWRAAYWLAFAVVILALLSLAQGFRPDIAACLRRGGFVIGMLGALATGILAAIAAFNVSLPDRSRRWLLLPLPALLLWVSTIGYGCLTDWVSIGPNGLRMGEAARCFATLLLTSAPLSIALLIMLRYAALLRPVAVGATAGLAVAAFTAFALSLFHDIDASVMIIAWNLGTAALIAGLASLFGKTLFGWAALRLAPGRVAVTG